jgi:hypothetical protein
LIDESPVVLSFPLCFASLASWNLGWAGEHQGRPELMQMPLRAGQQMWLREMLTASKRSSAAPRLAGQPQVLE